MPSDADARTQVIEYLRTHHVLTIATTGEDGPAAAAVFYVNRHLDFYFLSTPGSLHCRNTDRDPRASATIQEDYSGWAAIRGVQLTGVVRQLESTEAADALALFTAKFPDVPLAAGSTRVVAEAVSKARWYGLSATRLRFIDNVRAFGHRSEWSDRDFMADAEHSGRN